MQRTSAAAAAIALAAFVASARPAAGDALDEFVKAQAEKRHVPGIAWAVLSDRSAERYGAYGKADLAWSAPATPDTVFAVGTLSDSFAAQAVMLLVQDGAMRLDARVDGILDGLPAAWGSVTVRQLLTHTSGLPPYADLSDFAVRRLLPVTPAAFLAAVGKEPLRFRPGTRWAPSGTDAYLLGLLVEKVSGMPFGEFLERRIARPAGLAATRLDDGTSVVPRRATGTEWRDAEHRLARPSDPTWSFAASGILSTARDLARWADALRGGTALSRTSLEVMWTPVSLAGGGRFPWGFGWHLESYRGRRAVWQTGHAPGFSSAVLLFPSNGLTVVVLANSSDASPLRIARGIASFSDPALPSAERATTRPDGDTARRDRTRLALAEAASGGANPQALTPAFAAALLPAQRARAASVLKGLRSVGLVTCDKPADALDVYGAKVAQVCTFRYDVGGTPIDVDHWLTADGRIAWVDVDSD